MSSWVPWAGEGQVPAPSLPDTSSKVSVDPPTSRGLLCQLANPLHFMVPEALVQTLLKPELI